MNEKINLDVCITNAMHRIEDLYYKTNGKCYLSFSGGKDSTVLLALIKMCEDILTIPKNSIPAVFCDTGIELGATKDFVKWVKENWYQNIVIIKPQITFSQVIKDYGKPMKSKLKSEYLERYQNNKENKAIEYLLNSDITKNFAKTKIANKDLHLIHPDFDIKVSNKCCEKLKKRPFSIYNKRHDIEGYYLGIRTNEGGARVLNAKKRLDNGGKLCTATKGKYTVKMPIIDWTNEEMEMFIKKYNVPLSKAYTEQGYERTGCFLCPFSLQINKNLEKLYKYEPNRYKASMFWLKDVYIAQNIVLPFDHRYETERKKKWNKEYKTMRYEMLLKYRPYSACKFEYSQTSIFDYLEE